MEVTPYREIVHFPENISIPDNLLGSNAHSLCPNTAHEFQDKKANGFLSSQNLVRYLNVNSTNKDFLLRMMAISFVTYMSTQCDEEAKKTSYQLFKTIGLVAEEFGRIIGFSIVFVPKDMSND